MNSVPSNTPLTLSAAALSQASVCAQHEAW
jgi:hypothetical protein